MANQFPISMIDRDKEKLAIRLHLLRWWRCAGVIALVIVGFIALSARDVSLLSMGDRVLLAIVFVQPIMVLSLLMMAIRLKIICGPRIEVAAAFEAACFAQLAQQILPSRLSEAVKPLYLYQRSGFRLTRGVAAIVLERVLDIAGIGLLLLWLIGFAGIETLPALREAAPLLWAVAGLCVAGILMILCAPKILLQVIRLIPHVHLRRAAARLFLATRRSAEPKRLTAAATLTVAVWVCSVALFVAFFDLAGSLPLTHVQWLVVFVVSTLGLVISIAPGGLGTFDAAIVVSMHGFGYPIAESLLLAMGYRIANNAVPAIVTIWLVTRGKLDIGALLYRLHQFVFRRANKGRAAHD